MIVLRYKIKSPVDIESISDELAGFPAAVRVTEQGTIEVAFDDVVTDETHRRIDKVMSRLGAEPTPD